MFRGLVACILPAFLTGCADSTPGIDVGEASQRMNVSDAASFLCRAGIEISPRPSIFEAEIVDVPIVTLGITCPQGFSFGVTMDESHAKGFFGPDRLDSPTGTASYKRLDGSYVVREASFRLSATEDLQLTGSMGPAYLLTAEGTLGAIIDPSPATSALIDPATFTCRSYASVSGTLTPLPSFCNSAATKLELPSRYVLTEVQLSDL